MNYDFLKDVTNPRHMVVAIRYLGVKEIPGLGRSNPAIILWAKNLGLTDIYKDDDQAWCALYYADCMFEAGRQIVLPGKDKYDYIRALKYRDAANMQAVKKGDEQFGDTLIFKRDLGGHIGFYVAEDEKCFHVLGGNQGNSVKVARLEKSRLVHASRPRYTNFVPDKMWVAADGSISQNEA